VDEIYSTPTDLENDSIYTPLSYLCVCSQVQGEIISSGYSEPYTQNTQPHWYSDEGNERIKLKDKDGCLLGVAASETSVNVYQTTRRNNPEDSKLHTCRRENLKSHKLEDVFKCMSFFETFD
jgi:hypothetical protein